MARKFVNDMNDIFEPGEIIIVSSDSEEEVADPDADKIKIASIPGTSNVIAAASSGRSFVGRRRETARKSTRPRRIKPTNEAPGHAPAKAEENLSADEGHAASGIDEGQPLRQFQNLQICEKKSTGAIPKIREPTKIIASTSGTGIAIKSNLVASLGTPILGSNKQTARKSTGPRRVQPQNKASVHTPAKAEQKLSTLKEHAASIDESQPLHHFQNLQIGEKKSTGAIPKIRESTRNILERQAKRDLSGGEERRKKMRLWDKTVEEHAFPTPSTSGIPVVEPDEIIVIGSSSSSDKDSSDEGDKIEIPHITGDTAMCSNAAAAVICLQLLQSSKDLLQAATATIVTSLSNNIKEGASTSKNEESASTSKKAGRASTSKNIKLKEILSESQKRIIPVSFKISLLENIGMLLKNCLQLLSDLRGQKQDESDDATPSNQNKIDGEIYNYKKFTASEIRNAYKSTKRTLATARRLANLTANVIHWEAEPE